MSVVITSLDSPREKPAMVRWCSRVVALPRALRIAVVAIALLGAAPVEEMPVPIDVQVPLLIKVLGFDRSLALRPGGEVLILVAYQSAYRSSREAQEDLVRHIAATGALKVGQKVVRWQFVDANDPEASTKALLTQEGATVLYVAPLRAMDASGLAEMARQSGALSVTGVPQFVGQGIVVGIGLRQGRPSVLINLRAARAAAAEFGAQLLQVAEIVES